MYHKKLRDELFKNRNYDPYALPLKDHTKGLNVTIKLSLIQIVDLVKKIDQNIDKLLNSLFS